MGDDSVCASTSRDAMVAFLDCLIWIDFQSLALTFAVTASLLTLQSASMSFWCRCRVSVLNNHEFFGIVPAVDIRY